MKKIMYYCSSYQKEYVDFISFCLINHKIPIVYGKKVDIHFSETFLSHHKNNNNILTAVNDFLLAYFETHFLDNIRGLCGYEIIRHFFDVNYSLFSNDDLFVPYLKFLKQHYPTKIKQVSNKIAELSHDIFLKGYHKGKYDHTVRQFANYELYFETIHEILFSFMLEHENDKENIDKFKMMIKIFDASLKVMR